MERDERIQTAETMVLRQQELEDDDIRFSARIIEAHARERYFAAIGGVVVGAILTVGMLGCAGCLKPSEKPQGMGDIPRLQD